MQIIKSLHKRNVICACGCTKELTRGDPVNKMNGKYYDLYHGRIYRLHVAGMRFIRNIVRGMTNG